MTQRLMSARVFAATSCLWWLGVVIYHYIQLLPGPFTPDPWVRWDQMYIVYRVAPWMALPFVVLVVGIIAARLLKTAAFRTPPAWTVWACGTAATLWTGFVVWRAHEQSFNCALWAPGEIIFAAQCSLPHLLFSGWLAIPVAAWLLFAAVRPRPSVA